MIKKTLSRPLRISPSAMNTFFKCSFQFKLSNIDEMMPDIGSDNLFAVLGTAIHKVSELNDKFNFSYDELRKAFKFIFLSYMTDARFLPNDIEYQSFLSRGYDLLRNTFELKKRWKELKIIDTERYYRVPYENSFVKFVYLSAKIDLVLNNPINKTFIALDWKTAKTHNEDIDNDLQLTFYIYFIHIIYGISYENIFSALAYPHDIEVLFTQRVEKDVHQIMFEKIELMLLRIANDDFNKEPKISGDLNKCTFCPYINSCDKL